MLGDTTLRGLIVAALVTGVLLITFGGPLVTTVGVIVTIVGLMSLMPVVHRGLVDEPA